MKPLNSFSELNIVTALIYLRRGAKRRSVGILNWVEHLKKLNPKATMKFIPGANFPYLNKYVFYSTDTLLNIDPNFKS